MAKPAEPIKLNLVKVKDANLFQIYWGEKKVLPLTFLHCFTVSK